MYDGETETQGYSNITKLGRLKKKNCTRIKHKRGKQQINKQTNRTNTNKQTEQTNTRKQIK